MPLQQARTEPTGLAATQAYGVITDWNLQGAANTAIVTLSWYATKAAFTQGLQPFRKDVLTLTLAEQQAGVSQLIHVLYAIIQARPDYVAAVSVS